MANSKEELKEQSLSEENNARKDSSEADMMYKELLPVKSFVKSFQNASTRQMSKTSTEFDTTTDSDSLHTGNTNLLWIASSRGHIEVVNLLIESKEVNIDQPNENNITPLMVASRNQHHSVVCALLNANAKTDAEENNGWTAMHMAAFNGNADIIKALIEHNKDIVNKMDKKNVTPLMVACENGHHEVVQALLNANAIVDVENVNGWNALHIAAHHGNERIIEELVKSNPGILKKTKNERSALHIAAAQGQCNAVKKLMELNADVTQVENIKKFTVLHAAAEGGHNDVLEILLQNEVLQSMINDGDKRWNRTPLLLASWKGSIKCVQLLCDMKADVSIKTEGGFTPMHWAAALGRTEIIKILYKAKADINALNEAMETPFDLARRRHHESACTLLKKYAEVQNNLVSATKNGNIMEVKRLLENITDINFKCQFYDNPAGFDALECDHNEILRTLRCTKIMMQCSWKDIALLLASYEGDVSKVSYLLKTGANINAVTEQGWTPLMIASENGNEYVVERLLADKADVNAVTMWNQSALLFAAWGNYGRILQMLIKANANVNLTTKGGWTAYQWALTLDNQNALLVLREHNPSETPNEKSNDAIRDLLDRNEIHLDINDHHLVFEETKKVYRKWRAIGRKLDFRMQELDSICDDCRRREDLDYYEALLLLWMNRAVVTAEQLSNALISVGYERIAVDFLNKMKQIKRGCY